MHPCNRLFQFAADKLHFKPLVIAAAYCGRTVFRMAIMLKRTHKTTLPAAEELADAEKRLQSAWRRPQSSCCAELLPSEETMDISVIVPVYNAEKYIEACLESIIGQETQARIEIIAVNDGSKDRSKEILDRMAEKHACLTVIHKQNGGAASARNRGLELARGKYVMFVDADDMLLPGAISKLLNGIKSTDADLLQAGWRYMDGPKQAYPNKVFEDDDLLQAIELMGVPWGKIMKRKLFDNVCFPEGFTSYEDTIIKCLILKKCRRVAMLSDVLYAWRKTPDGITASTERTPRAVQAYWAVEECEKAAVVLAIPESLSGLAISVQQTAMALMRLSSMDESIRQAAFDLFRSSIVPKLKQVNAKSLPFANRKAAAALMNGDRALLEYLGKRWAFIM